MFGIIPIAIIKSPLGLAHQVIRHPVATQGKAVPAKAGLYLNNIHAPLMGANSRLNDQSHSFCRNLGLVSSLNECAMTSVNCLCPLTKGFDSCSPKFREFTPPQHSSACWCSWARCWTPNTVSHSPCKVGVCSASRPNCERVLKLMQISAGLNRRGASSAVVVSSPEVETSRDLWLVCATGWLGSFDSV